MSVRNSLVALAVLSALAFVVYYSTIDYPFVYDDEHVIVNNPAVKKAGNIPGFFVKTGMEGETDESGSYRPLLYASFAANYRFSGLKPAGYRLTNIALHIINSFLVFLVIMAAAGLRGGRFPWPWALAASALFCLHPLQTEPVIYISARSVVLLATLCLLSFYLYLKYKISGNKFFLAAAAVSFALALATKEEASPFMLVFVLAELYFAGRDKAGKAAWAGVLPFALMTALFVPLRLWFFRHSTSVMPQWSYGRHWINETAVLPRYAKLFLWPSGMSIEHYIPDASLSDPYLVSGLLLLIAFFFFASRYFRKDRLLLVFLAWPLLCLLTEMLFPLPDLMVDYRPYLGIAGIVVFICLLAQARLANLRGAAGRLAMGAAVCTLAVLGAMSCARTSAWASPAAIWQDAIDKYPNLPRPYYNIGVHYLKQGDYGQAEKDFTAALSLKGESAEVYTKLGDVYSNRGEGGKAVGMYEKAIGIKDTYYSAWNNLGREFGMQGDNKKAMEALRKAVSLKPENDSAYTNLGNVYSGMGRPDEAARMYGRALELNPQNTEAGFNLGATLVESGRCEEALGVFNRTIVGGGRGIRALAAEKLASAGRPDLAAALK